MVRGKRILYSIFFFVLFSISGLSQPSVDGVKNNFFPGIFSFSMLEVQPASKMDIQPELYVYVFLSPECPLCQHYIPELKRIQSAYKNKILIKGIVPGKTYNRDTLIYFKNEYGINFPLFIDSVKALSDYLSATVTPEVMVFTKKGERIYQGAIDDWMKKLGEKKIKPTAHYLEEAIAAALNNGKIIVSRTEAKGCLINDF